MRDASIRVLTSAAAALLVFGLVTATGDVSLPWRIAATGVVAIAAWVVAGLLAKSSAHPDSSDRSTGGTTASNIRGRNVTVRGVKASRRDRRHRVASDIDARRDVDISDITDRDE